MKANIAIKLLGLILGVALITSCTPPTVTKNTETPQHSPTLTAGSATPLLTLKPTFSPIPTIIPTLSAEFANSRLLALLADNGNCRLPCVWGLTPGKSSSYDAQAVLSPISSLSEVTSLKPEIGSISPEYTENGISIYTKLGFLTESNNNIINRISFRVEAHKKSVEGGYENVFDSAFFGNQVKIYELSNVLSSQGIPTAVLISTLAAPPTRGSKEGFYVLLLYPEQGILAHYTAQWTIIGENIQGCLANAHVALELFPSDQADSFSEFLSQTRWAHMWPVPIDSPTWKPIDKATSMTLEQFYETFRQSTDKCIETPANLWPTPEP